MTKPIPYLMLGNAVSLTLANGDNHVINSSHPNFGAIVGAIKGKEWYRIESLINIPKAIAAASGGKVTVTQNEIRYNGLPVHSYLATRILTLLQQGFDITPWTNFMEKLYQNPDPYSLTQLYSFLERAKLPLTPDGDFLAYKKVRQDYKDIHSGTFDNSVGQKPKQDRATCDNNPNNHCARGLHFCSKGYLSSFGGSNSRTVLVKVNPMNVVSVPNDHNCEKARACEYEVVGELDEDYSYDDMEAHEVLPTPRVAVEVNKPNKKAVTAAKPSDLVQRIVKSTAATVREIAKNLGVKQSDIVNNAGVFYTIEICNGESVGQGTVQLTNEGEKI